MQSVPEKRLHGVSFRCGEPFAIVSARVAPELKEHLAREAEASGVRLSTLLESRHPLLETVATLEAEAAEALSDDRLSGPEKSRLTDLVSDCLYIVRRRSA